MLKRNKKMLAVTSLITLLPVVAGLILWDRLPEQIPTHWNAAGEIDGWSSKPFAVFALPAIILGIHWLCVFAAAADPKNKGNNEKYFSLVLWISPVLSVLVGALIYCAGLGTQIRMERVMPILIGGLFVFLGNRMPKLKQNFTMGIKLPWTMYDEENWNKTHRLAGKLWVVTGVIIMISGFFNWFYVTLIALVPTAVAPAVYSYWLYRKKTRG